jgi:hypothetical protein
VLSLGTLAFATPWMLLALTALPLLWWLLRLTPPAPRRVVFPAIQLLRGLVAPQETPHSTPWWLLLLRLLIAVLIIAALAQPLLNPGSRLGPRGAVLLVVDDGWAAAADWPRRRASLDKLLAEAERKGRPVLLLTTAPPAGGGALQVSEVMPAGAARELVAALEPKPWPVDRAAARRAIAELDLGGPADVVWLSDGLQAMPGGDAAILLAERLQRLGPVQLVAPRPAALAKVLLPPEAVGTLLSLRAWRAPTAAAETVWLRALGQRGQVLARQRLEFAAASQHAEQVLELPAEMRNRLARLELENAGTAAGVVLLDERWRRRPVGLVSGSASGPDQPLLSSLYYLERALAPFAEIRQGKVAKLLARRLALLVLADVGQVVGPDRARIEDWLDRGGVLVRFAGPRLAEQADDLVPVPLRVGGRNLGGALTWTQPVRLAPFAATSPFAGLVPPDDVLVWRQVLAQPSLQLGSRTWARLADGTPLITAERRGRGWIVLFHTSADTSWSNLSLSGLFVAMLQRIVALAEGVPGAATTALPALSVLDGFGRAEAPPATARPIAVSELQEAGLDGVAVGPVHPPGLYGSAQARHALNLGPSVGHPAALAGLPQGITVSGFAASREVDLKPWLLAAAVLLTLIEFLLSLGLRGLLQSPLGRRATILGAITLVLLAQPQAARAQATDDEFALAATLETRLAYVITDFAEIDEMSRAGLSGLTRLLDRRTAVEGGEPLGVDLELDELVFFPLLYWPVLPEQRQLSPAALAKVDAFMKNGGTILFDTRDEQMLVSQPGFGRLGAGSPARQRLRQLLNRLDVPPLVPVPQQHILTKAFYLLQQFPGRWSGGPVWVERHAGGVNDGVSALVIGSHDWAAAWAVDDQGRPLAAVVPGGERQRETAFRFGINLVMYTLTGNYKSDQVHVPAILERLGQ